jgi:molecular chaperone DnaK
VIQRRATILAGEKAGLHVVDILNEPTAAALAYREQVLEDREKRILVYDLGGGTFDVSLLEAQLDKTGYAFFTTVIDGDTRLGGDDIDASLVRWLSAEIKQRYGQDVRTENHVARAQLRLAAEQAKIALTTTEVYELILPAFELGASSAFDVRVELTRTQLEACAASVIEKTIEITKRAVLEVAQLDWKDIDEVILVGGQTLMPAIRREVKKLTGREPRVNDRPQLAVALGAGEYAHILSLGQEKFHQNALINVLALPLGLRLDDNTFEPLVQANTPLPFECEWYQVTTTQDNQSSIRIDILQGPREATKADQCIKLASIEMPVMPAPARTPKFEIKFLVSKDGTMEVKVADRRTNRIELKKIQEVKQALQEQPAKKNKETHETQ